MRRRVVSILAGSLVVLASLLWVGSPTAAVRLNGSASPRLVIGPRRLTRQTSPVTIRHLGLSQPLREAIPTFGGGQTQIIPLRHVPHGRSFGTDPIVQLSPAKTLPTSAGLNFDGLGQGVDNYTVAVAPPDANGAAGATQYVQWANLALTVYDKTTGTLVSGPTSGNTLFNDLNSSGTSNCGATNDGDPTVNYDAAAQRWVLAQVSKSLAEPNSGNPPYEECIAVSTSSDATGKYNLYSIPFSSNLPDAPKLAVWSDAYYFSANMFQGGLNYIGPEVCAIDRSVLISGGTPSVTSVQCFTLSTDFSSVLPASLDGATAPPAGSPEFFMSLDLNSLDLWQFHVDFVNSANTTFSASPVNIPVATFNEACGGGTCIPQKGTPQLLDSLADRLMYRLAYRNFGDHEALLLNHSVNPSTKKKFTPNTVGLSAIRWYELRDPAGTPTIFQSGTYAPDKSSRWMGSIATDKNGDMAVGYSVSSGNMFPAIRYTGRVPSDVLGTLEGEVSIFEGSGSQLTGGGGNRWGDYSSMSVDPVDDCTFYYTNQYQLTDGNFNWNTRIASFKFPGCN